MRCPWLACFLVFFVAWLPTVMSAPARGEDPEPSREPASAALPTLPIPPALKKNIDFWVGINTRYSTSQGIIHDTKYIDKVYEVLDLRGLPRGGGHRIRLEKLRWRTALLGLHRKQDQPETWTEDEKKVAKLYEDVDEPNKFLNAAHRKRLRFQLGQKERFLDGLEQSGRFLPAMEEIFRKQGMPPELTRLPFVESSFNLRARSKVGASGIWQFMSSTAKLFIQVNDAVDERNDPLRATEAAAKLLKLNYESLGAWPLAVTAYNHGRKGMMRAVRKVGTLDLDQLMSDYHSRSFGFASSNFYVELLSAIEIEKNAAKYFGQVEREAPLRGVEVTLPDYVALSDLCRFLKLPRGELRELNPALSEDVYAGRLLVPANYVLRLPRDGSLAPDAQRRLFLAGYAQIPGVYKQRSQQRRAGARLARRGRR